MSLSIKNIGKYIPEDFTWGSGWVLLL